MNSKGHSYVSTTSIMKYLGRDLLVNILLPTNHSVHE